MAKDKAKQKQAEQETASNAAAEQQAAEQTEAKQQEQGSAEAQQQPESSNARGEGESLEDRNSKLLKQLDEMRSSLDKAEKQASEANDKMMRAYAEMENAKRRAEKDVANAHKYALEKFVEEMLPVLDSMEKAANVDSEQTSVASMQEGVSMTLKLFLDVAGKFNIEQINPEGETFDPEKHEAMVTQPSEELPANTVLEVYQKGYLLNGRVVRPARVVVSR